MLWRLLAIAAGAATLWFGAQALRGEAEWLVPAGFLFLTIALAAKVPSPGDADRKPWDPLADLYRNDPHNRPDNND